MYTSPLNKRLGKNQGGSPSGNRKKIWPLHPWLVHRGMSL